MIPADCQIKRLGTIDEQRRVAMAAQFDLVPQEPATTRVTCPP